MSIEFLRPGRSRIRKQNRHMIRRLGDFLHQSFHLAELGEVRWDGYRPSTGSEVRQGVERRHGRFTC